MIKNKHITAVCCILTALALVFTCLFAAGMLPLTLPEHSETEIGYEELFDTSYVHSINIDVDEDSWQDMLDNATAEEYISCDVTIDGTTLTNVAIRPKGNTSLSNVESLNSERYSFKIKFDEYDDGTTYKGLDKLCLNNIIQDNTYMKDYFSYRMMSEAGALAPLCSFIYITVNNEDWGLYLAVEAIEEAFARRNFGENYGQIYKPESMAMGGGMGRKNDSDDNDGVPDMGGGSGEQGVGAPGGGGGRGGMNGGGGGGMNGGGPGGGQPGQGGQPRREVQTDEAAPVDVSTEIPAEGGGSEMSEMPEMPEMTDGEMPSGGEPGEMPEMTDGEMPSGGEPGEMPEMTDGEGSDIDGMGGAPGGGGGGMSGSDVVALVYQDDDIDSYSSIFDYSVFNPDYADKKRLIKSIKQLNEGENLEDVVDVDEVLRYFVAHNFVVNFDSYTGSMMHNYYLYEDDGQLSMIAWDYNLAFGAYSGGGGGSSSDDATEAVNYPIDTPLSGTTMDERPMIGKLFENEEYLERYHELFDEFIESYFESGEFENEYYRVYNMILEYVAKDPTKFCTLDEFVTGADTLRQFCLLRAESVRGQLDGTIPSTDDDQSEDSSSLIDASFITISDMGSMNAGGGGGGQGGESPDTGGMPQGGFDEAGAGAENADGAPDMSGGMNAGGSETAAESTPEAAEAGENSREGEFNIEMLSEMLDMDVSELEEMTQDEIRELLQEKINNGEINLSPRGNRVMEEENDNLKIYALLGVSGLVLVLGILLLALFKRRRN